MLFFKATIALVLLPLLTVAGSVNHVSTPARRALKQFNPHRQLVGRGTTEQTSDTCASTTINLGQELGKLLNISLPQLGNMQLCLCLSDIDAFIGKNIICDLAAGETSVAKVKNAMTKLINNAAGKQACSYPSNSSPMCSTNNVCAFTCTNGYTASGGQCTCSGYVCNGKCQTSKCPVASRGFSNRKRHAPSCPVGYTMCGVASFQDSDASSSVFRQINDDASDNRRPYECLETRSNIESCGGCIVPLTLSEPANGKDCTTIPHMTSVSCRQGQCNVEACRKGYVPDATHTECIQA